MAGIRYNARAVSHDWGKSQKKGTHFVSVVFQVAESDAKAPGAEFVWEGYFTDLTTDRTIKSLRYCGCTFPGNDVSNLEGITRNTVSITIEETEYGPRVAWVNAVGNVNEENRLGGGELKSLAAKLRGAVVASASASGAKAAPARAAAPAPFEAPPADPEYEGAPAGGAGADEIPF